ncbi:hypothetical protein SUGI_1189180 [Cryptomeria japonica]|nr:hypothetical protein SUGI_1189180 [Cryptomeria japonica]
MENEEGREILIFGKRIRVGGENNGSVSHENGNEKGEKRKYIKSLMPRIRWTSDLHDSFLRAVQQLGRPNSEYSFNLSLFFIKFFVSVDKEF